MCLYHLLWLLAPNTCSTILNGLQIRNKPYFALFHHNISYTYKPAAIAVARVHTAAHHIPTHLHKPDTCEGEQWTLKYSLLLLLFSVAFFLFNFLLVLLFCIYMAGLYICELWIFLSFVARNADRCVFNTLIYSLYKIGRHTWIQCRTFLSCILYMCIYIGAIKENILMKTVSKEGNFFLFRIFVKDNKIKNWCTQHDWTCMDFSVLSVVIVFSMYAFRYVHKIFNIFS